MSRFDTKESTSFIGADVMLRDSALRNCEALGKALGDGGLAETVEEVQNLILRYYNNVREQAAESFSAAKRVATIGFVLLIVTTAYVILTDLLLHIPASGFVERELGGMNVGAIGLIAAGIVEAIAGTQFVLYGRATRQFGAFHICLERTHRYLVAYKMAETMGTSKDDTLEKLVCIMANAPMITRQDIEGVMSPKQLPDTTKSVADSLLKAGVSSKTERFAFLLGRD
jgi:hypothetical protein